MSLRIGRINSEIQHKIAEIIREEIDDPHLGIVSISRVDTTPDLKESRVYFSVLDNDFIRVKKILDGMKSFIRVSLGKRIRIRILPQLVFIPDDSIKYSVDIYEKIEEVMNNEKSNRNDKKQ